jgi:hypothetical protein
MRTKEPIKRTFNTFLRKYVKGVIYEETFKKKRTYSDIIISLLEK